MAGFYLKGMVPVSDMEVYMQELGGTQTPMQAQAGAIMLSSFYPRPG